MSLQPVRAIHSLARKLGLSAQMVRLFGGVFMSPSRMRRLYVGYEPTGRDVFVATYMKSGTNWAMQIATQIAHRGAAEFDHIHDLVPWPEVSEASYIDLNDPRGWQESPTGLRVIKSHACREDLPQSPDAKYIVVIRDPKEVMVSAYHFSPPILGVAGDLTHQDWLHMFPPGEDSGWMKHTLSWWAMRDRANVLVLDFAGMKADLPGTVDRIAALMGVRLTENERAAVIERSGLAWMKANKEKFAPLQFPFSSGRPDMIRSGSSGNAGELLSAEEQAYIDRENLAALERLGSDFPYRTLFSVVE